MTPRRDQRRRRRADRPATDAAPFDALLFRVSLAVSAVVLVLSRLPQLMSDTLMPDGDEAILGLMAEDIARGRGFPIFFYGQSYGLSCFEAGAVALAFRLLGPSALTLKAPMLMLWAIGWLFLVLSVHRLGGARAASIAAWLMALAPAWGAWSLKARGGYITAFVFAHLALWLLALVSRDDRARALRLWGIGACLAVVHYAQPLWLLVIVPFLALLAGRGWTSRDLMAGGSGLAMIVVLVLVLSGQRSAYWDPQLFHGPDPVKALIGLPETLSTSLSGAYYIQRRLAPGPWTALGGVLWSLALLAAGAWQSWAWWRDRRYSVSSACLVGSSAVILLSLAFARGEAPFRYLLPASGLLVMLLALTLAQWTGRAGPLRTAALGLILALGVSSTVALIEFGPVSFSGDPGAYPGSERRALQDLVDTLRAQGVTRVYSMDPLLQWKIMFWSHREVLARWRDPRDRVPAYARAVDDASRAGAPTALVGYRHQLPADGHLQVVDGRYVIFRDPPAWLLRSLGFVVDAI